VHSLVVPIGHYHYDEEQLIRTKKLEKLGIVEVIEPSQLEPNYLAERIIECLNKNSAPKKAHPFDLEGAKKTAVFLEELLQEQPLVAA
jgi:predicted glycosyltransferase